MHVLGPRGPFAGHDLAGLRAELDRLRAKSVFLGGVRETNSHEAAVAKRQSPGYSGTGTGGAAHTSALLERTAARVAAGLTSQSAIGNGSRLPLVTY